MSAPKKSKIDIPKSISEWVAIIDHLSEVKELDQIWNFLHTYEINNESSKEKRTTKESHGYCLKTFKTNQELKLHTSHNHSPTATVLDVELAERRCPHCGQRFHFATTKVAILKAHILSCFMNKYRKFNKEPLQCPHCEVNKKFLRKANLLAHIRNKHPDTPSPAPTTTKDEPATEKFTAQTLIDQIHELDNNSIDPLLLFDVESATEESVPRLKMDSKRLQFRFSQLAQKMAQHGWFMEVLSTALAYLVNEQNLRSNDFVSVALESPEGKLLDYPLVSPFYKGDEWMVDVFLNRVQNVLQSHSTLGMNSDLILTITTIESPPVTSSVVGTSKTSVNPRRFASVLDFLARKSGIVDVRKFQLKKQNYDNSCLPLCVAICVFCANKTKITEIKKNYWWKRYLLPTTIATMVENIYDILGLEQNTQIPISNENLESIQCWLVSRNKRLIVTKIEGANFPEGASTIYDDGPSTLPDICHLLVYKNHTFWVENEKLAFGGRKRCQFCTRYVKNNATHAAVCQGMPKKCRLCHTNACFDHSEEDNDSKGIVCNSCYRAFRNSFCLNQHRNSGLCEQEQRCPICFLSGTPARINRHQCYYRWCRTCRDYVPINDHQHYVTPIVHYSKQQMGKSVGPQIFLFYDIESRINDENMHTPICLIIFRVCEKCIMDFEISNACSYCGSNRQLNFLGINCMHEAVKFMLFHESNRNAIAIAHYASGYDSLFCLKALLAMGHSPKKGSMLVRNLKILSFIGGGCRVQMKDSFLWFRCRLAALPKMMGLKIEKLFFPHAINREDMMNYVGEWPTPDQYNVREEDREGFMKFYVDSKERSPIFDFRDELIKYCAQDVRVLHQSCARFRQIIMEFDGVDPLTRSISIAHLTSIIFRTKYLRENSIAIITDIDCGAESAKKQSHLALKFLSYLAKSRVPDLKYAGNSHERVFGKYCVDGYSPSKGIFEVLGCMWHGCLRERHTKHKGKHCIDKHLTWEDVNHRTMHRLQELEKFSPVHAYWECEIEDELITNVELKSWFSKRELWLDLLQPIHGRDALYGRTGASVCLLEIPNELTDRLQCHYYDINSLYPYCMCKYDYPIGWPKIINGYELPDNGKGMSLKALTDNFFGLIRCRVLPRQDLLFGALPWRSPTRGLLLFPVCLSCAEKMDHSSSCSHSCEERSFEGCWTTPELALALKVGYIVEHVHQIWHFVDKSNQLFTSYLKKYGTLKYKYGGIPSSYTGDAVRYSKDLEVYEGIKLNPNEISFNLDYYSMAKNLINKYFQHKCTILPKKQQGVTFIYLSLWGKLAQSSQKCSHKVDFLSTEQELRNIMNDPTVRLTNAAILDDKAMVETETNDEWIAPGGFHNPVLASFVTSYGRIELYRYLELYGENICYWDTDSVIFLTDKNVVNGPAVPKVSPFWGDMKSELADPDDFITKFVSLGAKNYLWQSNMGQQSFKCKGISMAGCTQGFGGGGRMDDYINFNVLKAILLNNNEVINQFYDNIENRELGEKLKRDGLARQEKTGGAVHLVLPQPQIIKRWKTEQPIYNAPDRTKAIRLSFDKRQLRYKKDSKVISIYSTEWGYRDGDNERQMPLIGKHPALGCERKNLDGDEDCI